MKPNNSLDNLIRKGNGCDILPGMPNELQFATHIARETAASLQKYLKKRDLETQLKSDNSIVTEADLTADGLIKNAIQETYPDDAILSEESVGLFDHRIDQSVWIVDPLDGSTNFSLGLQIWGILITRVVSGVPVMTVMYFPMLDELYHAQRGNGACLNQDCIRVQPSNSNRPFSFFACCSRTFRHFEVSIPYKARILGSAAYSFCALARGMALVSFEATPKIWDIAGPWLLVREAGGCIAPLNGDSPFPLQSGLDFTKVNYPMLAAPSQELLEKSRDQIRRRK